jgi:hypothetical protein
MKKAHNLKIKTFFHSENFKRAEWSENPAKVVFDKNVCILGFQVNQCARPKIDTECGLSKKAETPASIEGCEALITNITMEDGGKKDGTFWFPPNYHYYLPKGDALYIQFYAAKKGDTGFGVRIYYIYAEELGLK